MVGVIKKKLSNRDGEGWRGKGKQNGCVGCCVRALSQMRQREREREFKRRCDVALGHISNAMRNAQQKGRLSGKVAVIGKQRGG